MKLGFNWTNPKQAPLIKKLILSENIQFCEILIDNFLSFDPQQLKDFLQDTPVSFHIMQSRFIERNICHLKNLAKRFRKWIEVLEPFYISDHILQFTVMGRELSNTIEIKYFDNYKYLKEKINCWQEYLDTKVYFENFPSINLFGLQQVHFFDCLLSETKSGFLFDVSNAVITEHNSGLSFKQWSGLAKQTKHFHVGGFRSSDVSEDRNVLFDTHDQPLHSTALKALNTLVKWIDIDNTTLVVERDALITFDSIQSDMFAVKDLYA